MRIQFCGANRTVTGTCHMIALDGKTILLDCGMYQGSRDLARQMNQWIPDGALNADAIILSHGHLDHCGKLPVLVRAGYKGPIYATPATIEVSRVVLSDSADIQMEDAEYLNRRNNNPDSQKIQPLYGPDDVIQTMRLMRRTNYGQKVDLGNGISFTFFDAGHIIGSAYIVLEYTDNGKTGRTLFTADVGRYNTPIIRDPVALTGSFDHVITESTYGNTSHGPIDQVGPQLLDAVKHCIEKKSRLIVPAFAVGRTQTILWYMQRFIQANQIPAIPIFIDSPMGIEVTKIHSDFRENYDSETLAAIGKSDLFGMSRVTLAKSADESRQINSQSGPCVIIASSPTCEFGRVLHHLKQSMEKPNDVVVFVGWTPYNTLGRRLQDGQKRVRIFDRWYDVRCQIRTIHGLSAHADGDELLRFLGPTLKPETRFHVVHGEVDEAEGFAARLVKAGVKNVNIPAKETSCITG